MQLQLKKNNKFDNLDFYFIAICYSIISAIIFWQILDIDKNLFEDLAGKQTNLARYADRYNFDYLVNATDNHGDYGYYLITFFFNKIGVKFNNFLFTIMGLYIFIFIFVFNKISKSKD